MSSVQFARLEIVKVIFDNELTDAEKFDSMDVICENLTEMQKLQMVLDIKNFVSEVAV